MNAANDVAQVMPAALMAAQAAGRALDLVTEKYLKGAPPVRTELSSGAWIEHRSMGDLKGSDKRALGRVGKPQVAVGPGGEIDVQTMVSGMDVLGYVAGQQDAVWALIITGWSYDLPVPVLDKTSGVLTGAEAYEEIPLDDFDEIEALMEPYTAKLSRRPDPKGTTTSSSNGRSRASAAPGSPKG